MISGKKWMLYIGIFMIIFFVSAYFSIPYIIDGSSDEFYLRFTTPKQHSLIIGTSRAAQGIRPNVFNRSENRLKYPIFNFAFTGNHSPMGEVYYNAVLKKFNRNTTDSVFIIEVNPRSLSMPLSADPSKPPELSSFLADLQFVNMNPNFEYLAERAKYKLYQYVEFKFRGNDRMLLHNDGWLEITIPMDQPEIQRRMEQKLSEYRKKFESELEISDYRLSYLKKTIEYFSSYGSVYIVRMPVSEPMYELEKSYWNDFDNTVNQITAETGAEYINLIDYTGIVQTTDGHHLYKNDGLFISEQILQRINNNNGQQ